MRSRLARFLLIFAALALPLQTQAAIDMQLPMLDTQQQSLADMEEAHCPYHEVAKADQGKAQDQLCRDCGICHLAAAGYVPSAEVKTSVTPLDNIFAAHPVAGLNSHIAEPPQYPPKRSVAY